MDAKADLLSMTIEELENLMAEMGEQKFRAKQIFQWTNKGIKDIDAMTNLSKDLREKLKERAYINRLEVIKKFVSKIDGTIKYLFKLNDGNIIESVLMQYLHGYSACISSQVGCKMGCKFCASTGVGFVRNLTKNRIGNVVIMGIGEPLDNYENVVKWARHISVSTCGLVPEILRLAEEKIPVTQKLCL